MFVELDMTKEDDFDKFMRVMVGYTCIGDRKTYAEKKVRYVLLANKNAKFFYNQDGKTETVVALVDDWDDDDKLLIWGKNSLGVTSLEDLTKVLHNSFSFYKDYLISRKKHQFYVRIQWKDYKPSYMEQFHDSFAELEDEIGHIYFDFDIQPESYMEFRLKDGYS